MVVTSRETYGGIGGGPAQARAVAVARVRLSASGPAEPEIEHIAPGGIARDAGDLTVFYETVVPSALRICLFGAGHVGTALVEVLSTLLCELTWVDSRSDAFPAGLPPHVSTEVSPEPAFAVERAPPGAYFLVMTHSHALDLDICERILRRGDFRYHGLIGSVSKRRQFEKRLLRRGIEPHALPRMVCPIGIEGICGKHPGVIAIAVAAEILRLHETPAMLPAVHLDQPLTQTERA